MRVTSTLSVLADDILRVIINYLNKKKFDLRGGKAETEADPDLKVSDYSANLDLDGMFSALLLQIKSLTKPAKETDPTRRQHLEYFAQQYHFMRSILEKDTKYRTEDDWNLLLERTSTFFANLHIMKAASIPGLSFPTLDEGDAPILSEGVTLSNLRYQSGFSIAISTQYSAFGNFVISLIKELPESKDDVRRHLVTLIETHRRLTQEGAAEHVAALESDLKALSDISREKDIQVTELTTSVSTLAGNVDELMSKIDSLTRSLASLTEAHEATKLELSAYREEQSRLARELNGTKATVTVLRNTATGALPGGFTMFGHSGRLPTSVAGSEGKPSPDSSPTAPFTPPG